MSRKKSRMAPRDDRSERTGAMRPAARSMPLRASEPGGRGWSPVGAVSPARGRGEVGALTLTHSPLAMNVPVSVLLIRENAEQMTGGGCCGSLDDSDPTVTDKDLFAEAKKHQRDLGLLHRAIRRFFPDRQGRARVAVEIVDPRNQLYLAPRLVRDVLRYRPGWGAGLRAALQVFSLPAVVINGRVLSRRGQPLDPDAVCHEIRRALGEAEDGQES